MSNIKQALRNLLEMVKENFISLGFADRVDGIAGMIGAGEYELAYVSLCTNIDDLDITLSQQVYKSFSDLWSVLAKDIQQMEGADWHYSDYLGSAQELSELKSTVTLQRGKTNKTNKKLVNKTTFSSKFPWNAEPTGILQTGLIRYNENWKLSKLIEYVFDQLVQYGIQIYSVTEGTDFTFLIPYQLFPDQYAGIEKLLDEIAREVRSEVQYIDRTPQGHKLRIIIFKSQENV